MQPLDPGSAGPNILVQSASVQVSYGATLFTDASTPGRDVTEFLQPGSSITSDVTSTIHRSCTLVFDSTANLGNAPLVNPWMRLTDNDTGESVQFPLGVYVLSSPTPDHTFAPAQLNYTGYDLLQLLNQPIGDTFECPSGQDPVSVAATLIGEAVPSATIDYEDSGILATQPYSYPLDSENQFTYLQVVNDLLKIAGYGPVWVDWSGHFQLHAYVNPSDKEPEWIFDMQDPHCTVAEARDASNDLFDVPNWWRFVMNNLTGPPVEGVSQFTYEDDLSLYTSVFARGGQYLRKVLFVDAADYTALVNLAVQQIELDLMPAENFNLSIFPLPALWHRDVVTYRDPNLADTGIDSTANISRLCMVTQWSLPLDGSDDQSITLQAISPVIDDILSGASTG